MKKRVALVCQAQERKPPESGHAGQSPADHLPAHITRVTWFGGRADWSLDSRRILFLEKTFGDAYEIDLQTRIIGLLTAQDPADVGYGIFIFDVQKEKAVEIRNRTHQKID